MSQTNKQILTPYFEQVALDENNVEDLSEMDVMTREDKKKFR